MANKLDRHDLMVLCGVMCLVAAAGLRLGLAGSLVVMGAALLTLGLLGARRG